MSDWIWLLYVMSDFLLLKNFEASKFLCSLFDQNNAVDIDNQVFLKNKDKDETKNAKTKSKWLDYFDEMFKLVINGHRFDISFVQFGQCEMMEIPNLIKTEEPDTVWVTCSNSKQKDSLFLLFGFFYYSDTRYTLL